MQEIQESQISFLVGHSPRPLSRRRLLEVRLRRDEYRRDLSRRKRQFDAGQNRVLLCGIDIVIRGKG